MKEPSHRRPLRRWPVGLRRWAIGPGFASFVLADRFHHAALGMGDLGLALSGAGTIFRLDVAGGDLKEHVVGPRSDVLLPVVVGHARQVVFRGFELLELSVETNFVRFDVDGAGVVDDGFDRDSEGVADGAGGCRKSAWRGLEQQPQS
jgi:hypothetical protein